MKAAVGDIVRIKGPSPRRKGQFARIVAVTRKQGTRSRHINGSMGLYREETVTRLRYEVESLADGKTIALGPSHFELQA